MAFSEVIPLDTVLRNQLQIYQIALTQWGATQLGADPNSLVSPIFKVPIAGIAIDPESVISRCILRPTVAGVLDTNGATLPADIPLDKNRPLSARLSFPRLQGFDGGWGIVCAGLDRYRDSVNPIAGGADFDFGGATAAPDVFVPQQLRLQIFTDASLPAISVPARTPFHYQAIETANFGAGIVRYFIPVGGRKRFRVTCFSTTGAGTMELRGITGTGLAQQELLLAAAGSIAGTTLTRVLTDVLVSYLEIVFSNLGNASFTLIVDGTDD